MNAMKSSRLMSFARLLPAFALTALVASNPDILLASDIDFGSDGDAIIDQSCSMVEAIKDWMFRIVYILGAIGLVLIAISAFLGRFKFQHLIALGGGLFVVAAADLLIDFVTGATGETECTGSGSGSGGDDGVWL